MRSSPIKCESNINSKQIKEPSKAIVKLEKNTLTAFFFYQTNFGYWRESPRRCLKRAKTLENPAEVGIDTEHL